GGGEVVIPEIVVDELLMPAVLARRSVESDDAVPVEVVSLAIRSVKVGRWRTGGNEHQATLSVHGKKAPGVRARTIFPTTGGPGIAARFSVAGNGVKGPDEFACAGVPPSNVAVGTCAGCALAVRTPGDDDVLVDCRWRGKDDAGLAGIGETIGDSRLKIDFAVLSETSSGQAGFHVDGEKPISHTGEDTRGRLGVTGPVGEAADRSEE